MFQVFTSDRNDEPAHTHIALCRVAATVVRLPATEDCLASGGSIDEAQRVLAGEIRPIDDVRSTAEYRLRVAGNLLRQWWEETG